MATIGLDRLYYAKITEAASGDETYATPVQLAKAISADLSIELAEATLYADDGAAEIVKEFKSGTLSLGVDESSLMACLLHPGAVADLLDGQLALILAQAESLARRGIRVMLGGVDMADKNGPLYSPALFRELVLPRLRRLCAHYGSSPTFIFSSATIGQPGRLASQLCGLDVAEVTDDGSPRGERLFALWNPPLEDDVGGDLSPVALDAGRRLAAVDEPDHRDENVPYYLAKLDALVKKLDAHAPESPAPEDDQPTLF